MDIFKNLFGKKPQNQEPAGPQPSATTPWRTFSIFISSTFADMQAERDHLKNVVFPRVEEELQQHRIKLEIVDLRWGVDTGSVKEDEREATVLKVVLEEIERCKPFFIGLLGDRYGWVPPEERMKSATVGKKLLLPDKGKSVTALEIEFGVLANPEQLSRSVFYFRDPLPYEQLSPGKAAKFSDQFDPKLKPDEKPVRKAALDGLKSAIRGYFTRIDHPEKVKSYTTEFDKDSKSVVCGLDEWGDLVYNDILSECESHAIDTWDQVPQNKHEQELALLEAFIEEHTHITTVITEKGEEQVRTFCGRKKLIDELKVHLLSTEKENWGLVLTGESGSGKSAVFSMIYKIMMEEDCRVLDHSAGITPDAKSVAELLQKWNRQLSEFLKIKEEEPEVAAGRQEPGLNPEDLKKASPKPEIEKLQERFAELLYRASEKTKVVLLIDALDRFEPTSRAQYMTWLPGSLPAGVRVMVTAITGTEKNAVQYHKGLVSRSIDHFSEEEAREMLLSLCKKQHKDMAGKVQKAILVKKRTDGLKAASSPLWLSLAVNILNAMDADDFEEISGQKGQGVEQIDNYMLELVEKFPELPGELFLHLIKKAAPLFGEYFTPALFNLIACSRIGLRESDLQILVPQETFESWDALRFASLRRWFRMHLVEQGEGHQWNLAHSILRNTLIEEISEEKFKTLNFLIATHLLTLPVTDTIRITETMHHLIYLDDKNMAIGYYTSELEEEALAGATKVLAETVKLNETGLETIASFIRMVADNKVIFPALLKRYTYSLNDFLGEEGNLTQRLMLLSRLHDAMEKGYRDELLSEDFGYDKAALSEKLGDIHQSMGHMEEALKYFEKDLKLTEELYETNPHNESLKNGLAISYSKLGDIHQSMGHMEEALKYFEKRSALGQELYESNPHNISLFEGLGISYYKIAMIFKVMGNDDKGKEYFAQWKGIISVLAKNMPQIPKYQQWNQIEY